MRGSGPRRWGVLTATVLVGLGVSRDGHALNNLDYLDWACDGGSVKDSAIASTLLAECEVSQQPAARTACQTLSGTPFACYTPAISQPATSLCGGGNVSFSVAGNTGGYLGWSVSGTVNVTGSVTFKKTVRSCSVAPIHPPPDGQGGTYVVEAGTAEARAAFRASGTGYIRFLGMRVFGASFTKSCSDNLSRAVYASDTTLGCESARQECCEMGDATCCEWYDPPPEDGSDPIVTPR